MVKLLAIIASILIISTATLAGSDHLLKGGDYTDIAIENSTNVELDFFATLPGNIKKSGCIKPSHVHHVISDHDYKSVSMLIKQHANSKVVFSGTTYNHAYIAIKDVDL